MVHSGHFFFTYMFRHHPIPLRDAWSYCALSSLFWPQNKPQSHLQQSVWTHRSLTLVLRGWSLYLQTFTSRTDCWSTAAPSQWQPGSSRLSILKFMSHLCFNKYIYTYITALLLPWEVICQSDSAFLLLLTQHSHISFALQWGGEVLRLVITAQASLHAFGLQTQKIIFGMSNMFGPLFPLSQAFKLSLSCSSEVPDLRSNSRACWGLRWRPHAQEELLMDLLTSAPRREVIGRNTQE